MKTLIIFTIGIMLVSSCAQHATCPTYSNAGPKKNHHATHHPHYKPHR